MLNGKVNLYLTVFLYIFFTTVDNIIFMWLSIKLTMLNPTAYLTTYLFVDGVL